LSEPAPRIAIEQGLAAGDVAGVLEALPDWFGRPEAITVYAGEARGLVCVTARLGTKLIGLLTLKPSSPVATEIAVMGLLPEHRRQGLGRQMVDHAIDYLCSQAIGLVWVRTLGPSVEYAAYAETRAFYAATGFYPLVELPGHFGEGEAALFLVRPL
jgi:GNAT superfamily N-acetyltransferase